MASALAFVLVTGCAEVRKHAGAPAENDNNVLTGGPVTGTTIQDLPQAVKDTLKQKVPTAEIARIDKQNQNGQIIYKISFAGAAKREVMYIGEDGTVINHP